MIFNLKCEHDEDNNAQFSVDGFNFRTLILYLIQMLENETLQLVVVGKK